MSLAHSNLTSTDDVASETIPKVRRYLFPGKERDLTGAHLSVAVDRDSDVGEIDAPNFVIDVAVSPGRDGDARPRSPRISVVIPTRNEAKNLPYVLGRLPEGLHEVILVDGNSVDDTIEVATAIRPDIVVVLQGRTGKGNAMACGFAAATGDVLVMLDADGSADPQEIPVFVAALVEGADFAKGTRFAAGGGSSDITPLRAWGNGCLNRIANLLYGTQYTDLCYGYNAFWRTSLTSLSLDPREGRTGGRLWGDGFEIETIINTRVAKAGLRITEVPSYEYRRLHGETNLNTWRDGTRVLWALAVERFNGRGRRGGRSTHGSALNGRVPASGNMAADEDRAG